MSILLHDFLTALSTYRFPLCRYVVLVVVCLKSIWIMLYVGIGGYSAFDSISSNNPSRSSVWGYPQELRALQMTSVFTWRAMFLSQMTGYGTERTSLLNVVSHVNALNTAGGGIHQPLMPPLMPPPHRVPTSPSGRERISSSCFSFFTFFFVLFSFLLIYFSFSSSSSVLSSLFSYLISSPFFSFLLPQAEKQ